MRGAPTWRLDTKLYKFRWNCLPNNAAMKIRRTLNFGDVFCLSIIYHIPEFWLNLLNGYDFYFRCKATIKIYWTRINKVLLLRTWGPLIFISKFKFTKMSVQVLIQSNQRSENLCFERSRNHLCNAAPSSPLHSGPTLNVKLLPRAAWLSFFALCFANTAEVSRRKTR